MSAFRIVCGSATGLAAAGFLAANTVILSRYGWRVGEDETEKLINAIVAGQVPVVLALMPFILAITWRPGHWRDTRNGRPKWVRGRPSPIAILGLLLWSVFVVFNFMGAIGSIASQKHDYVDRREGIKDDAKRWKEARTDKAKQLAQIKEDRPPDKIQAEIDSMKLHRFWRATDGCRENEVKSRDHQKFCRDFKLQSGAISTATLSTKLRADIEDLDRRLESREAHIGSADPQSDTLASYASMLSGRSVDAAMVRTVQPLVWFLLLELSCMFLLYAALKFFGMQHTDLYDHAEPAPVHQRSLPRPRSVAGMMRASDAAEAVETIPLVSSGTIAVSDPALQRAIYDRFWAECIRPLPGGKETLLNIYATYRAYCSRPSNRSEPYPYNDFARLLPERFRDGSEVNGVLWVLGLVLADPMEAV